MNEVEYRDIPECFGYKVGSDGSVWAYFKSKPIFKDGRCVTRERIFLNTGKKLKPFKASTSDHLAIKINGKRYAVHRLILEIFVGACPEGMECCHADGNPTNNKLENLRWDTREANYQDRVKHGKDFKGERHKLAILTEDQVRAIRSEYVPRLVTQEYLGHKYGVTRETISAVLLRKNWPHVE